MATLLAWGRAGLAERVERCTAAAEEVAAALADDPRVELLAAPRAGVVLRRPREAGRFDAVAARLPCALVSCATLAGRRWFRHVAANPNVDVGQVTDSLRGALDASVG